MWIDGEPGFGAWLWLHNSLRWRFLSLWEGLRAYPKEILPPPSVDFGIKIEQLRSVFGEIRSYDSDNYNYSYDDGNFTAIWEAITADIVWTVFSSNPERPYEEMIINLVFEGSLYRQRINAQIGSHTFNQNEMGKSVEVKVEFKQ